MKEAACWHYLWFFVAAFSEGMVNDGYEDVVNVDISSVVIEAMQKKYCYRPQLKCTFFASSLFNWRFSVLRDLRGDIWLMVLWSLVSVVWNYES